MAAGVAIPAAVIAGLVLTTGTAILEPAPGVAKRRIGRPPQVPKPELRSRS